MEVRRELVSNLRHGGRCSDDYYFTLAAEHIWIAVVIWKDQDSDYTQRTGLTLKDIEYGCRRRGFRTERDKGELKVFLPNHTYVFFDTYFCSHPYGGPADAEGHYQGYHLIDGPLGMSMRTFFRILEWFDSEIDSVRPEVARTVEETCAAFRIAQIRETTLHTLLDPGLEGVTYDLRSRGNDVIVEVRYEKDRDECMGTIRAVRLRFGYDDVIGNAGMYRNVILRLNEHPEYWESYRTAFSAVALAPFGYTPLDEDPEIAECGEKE